MVGLSFLLICCVFWFAGFQYAPLAGGFAATSVCSKDLQVAFAGLCGLDWLVGFGFVYLFYLFG